ncbi:MAG: DNA polymerase/3'-5' exonuclease PolX [Verrucomicrobiales bacterium]
MTREAIADILEKIGLLLEMQGENPFKIRAYKHGAEIVRSHPEDILALAREGKLEGIPGLGSALIEKIGTLVATGTLPFWEKLKAPYPETIFDLFELPGLGPKKIRVLNEQLNIAGLGALKAACEAGKVAGLPGFGAKTEEKLLAALRYVESTSGQAHRDTATIAAEEILAFLNSLPDVLLATTAGSFRRGKETVGDLDFLTATSSPSEVTAAFAAAPFAKEVLAAGETKVSIRLESGLQADLRAVSMGAYPFALQYFTGSKEHNVAIRARARKRGWSLNEYGLTPLEENAAPAPSLPDEDSIYRFLDLDPIPPELRENFGEIEAAEYGTLPRLITIGDLRGTFHNHTTASDGTASLEEMAEAAIELGLAYLGIGDHSKAAVQANGLDESRLRAQMDAIRELNKRYESEGVPLRLFAGSEVDIMKDGRMDFSDDLLAELDYVVASVHNAFTIPIEEQTARIIAAMENPHVDMIGHLSGRLLLRREPYAIDTGALIAAAARTGTIIELNANAWRLDMDWRHWKSARDAGVLCAINPDAHSAQGLQHLRFGVESARKGWLRASDVLNTRPTDVVAQWLATPKAKRKP